jgi:hypothetical protein
VSAAFNAEIILTLQGFATEMLAKSRGAVLTLPPWAVHQQHRLCLFNAALPKEPG